MGKLVSDQSKQKKSWPLVVDSLLLMFIDLTFFFMAWKGEIDFVFYTLCHVGVSIVAWKIYTKACRLGIDIKFYILNATFITFLGPFSIVVTFLTLFFYLIFQKISTPVSQLLQDLNPEVGRSRGELCYQAIMTAGSVRVGKRNTIPLNYYDIVELGTTKQKQQAIAKILQHFHPRFIPILFALVNDEVSCIRVLAATAINTIDQKYTEMLTVQERIAEKFPDKLKELKKLASIAETYLELNILDEDRKLKLEDQVVILFQKLYEKLPNDLGVVYSYAKVLEAKGKKDQALKILEKGFKDKLQFSAKIKLFLLKIAFEKSSYEEWLKLLGDIGEEERDKENYLLSVEEIELKEILMFWKINAKLTTV